MYHELVHFYLKEKNFDLIKNDPLVNFSCQIARDFFLRKSTYLHDVTRRNAFTLNWISHLHIGVNFFFFIYKMSHRTISICNVKFSEKKSHLQILLFLFSIDSVLQTSDSWMKVFPDLHVKLGIMGGCFFNFTKSLISYHSTFWH